MKLYLLFIRNVKLVGIVETENDSDIGCTFEVIIKYPDEMKKKNNTFSILFREQS